MSAYEWFVLGFMSGTVAWFVGVRSYRRRWASDLLARADAKVRELELVRLRFGKTVFVPDLVEMRPGQALIDATLFDLATATKWGGGHVDYLEGGWFLELRGPEGPA